MSDVARPVLPVPGDLAGRNPAAFAAAAALAYPLLLIGFFHSGRMLHAAKTPTEHVTGWVVSLGSLLVVFAVPALAFWAVMRLGAAGGRPAARCARRIAHLAFAAPPLFTCLGVLLYLTKLDADYIAWALIWVAVLAVAFSAGGADAGLGATGRDGAALRSPKRALRIAHGISALAIVVIFLAPHIVNHLTGLISAEAHVGVMKTLRGFYRASVVEPVIVALFLFQLASGANLWTRKTRTGGGVFDAIQTCSAAYLAIFITSHMTAVFVLGRMALNVDTNWGFATGAPAGLMGDGWNVRLIPHYSLAVCLLVAHSACGLRDVLLAHGVAARLADRIAWTLIAGGVLVALLIILGMLGLHLSAPATR